MPKKAIFVHIREGEEEVSFSAMALQKEQTLTFQDSSRAWHTLTIETEKITLVKEGELSLSLTFEPFKRHEATMTFAGKTLALSVLTESMRQDPQGFSIEYSLWDGEHRLSQHQFRLMFKEGASYDTRA